MRNTRQGLLGFEGSDAPALQQLMEVVRALQEANEEHRRDQERIQEEAKVEQEKLQAKHAGICRWHGRHVGKEGSTDYRFGRVILNNSKVQLKA